VLAFILFFQSSYCKFDSMRKVEKEARKTLEKEIEK